MQPQPEAAWIGEVRRAVDMLGSIQAVATLLGYSRTAISLLLAGKYAKDTSRLEAAVRGRLTSVACPYMEAAISGADCIQNQGRTEPAAGSEEYWHWRACKACRVGAGKSVPA